MNCKKLLMVLFLICPLTFAFAQEAPEIKGKILIYNFYNATGSSDYGYYSYVIPDSVAIELRKHPQYGIQALPVPVQYADSSMSDEAYKTHMQFLADRGKEFSADLVITGSYTIERRTIFIKTQIYDVNEQKIKDIHESSDELGALLLVIIDMLSAKINTELQKGLETKKEKTAYSPFSGMYASMSEVTFGFQYGIASFAGEWDGLYEKTDVATVYLSYNLSKIDYFKRNSFLKHCVASANYDYFSAGGFDGGSSPSFLEMRGVLGNLAYLYMISPYFYLEGKAGGGVAFSEIEVTLDSGSSGPPPVIASRETTDPYFHLSAAMGFRAGHLSVTSGFAVKRIFYIDEPMDFTMLYFGIGWAL